MSIRRQRRSQKPHPYKPTTQFVEMLLFYSLYTLLESGSKQVEKCGSYTSIAEVYMAKNNSRVIVFDLSVMEGVAKCGRHKQVLPKIQE